MMDFLFANQVSDTEYCRIKLNTGTELCWVMAQTSGRCYHTGIVHVTDTEYVVRICLLTNERKICSRL